MKQDTPNRISVSEVYFNMAKPTPENTEVWYKKQRVLGIEPVDNHAYYRLKLQTPSGHEYQNVRRGERVTVNVASDYRRVELDV